MKISMPVFVISVVFLFGSCEKVIDPGLDDTDPRVVIEAKITDGKGPFTVSVTKSASYYSVSQPEVVSQATVIICSGSGICDTLSGTSPGIYTSSAIEGKPGELYNLKIISENTTYTSQAQMPSIVKIDTLKFEYSEGSVLSDAGIRVKCIFTDPVESKNYYCINLYQNNRLVSGAELYLYDDVMNNGNEVEYILYRNILEPGDIVTVELMGMDKALYDYFRVLSDILGKQPGPSTATPANPVSNISSQALGYFGVFATDIYTATVPTE